MPKTESEWLEERRSVVGASDCAAIIGIDPHKTAYNVYANKLGLESDEDLDRMAFGREVQRAIGGLFTRRTGIAVSYPGDYDIVYHPDHPWLGCTLDGIAQYDDGDGGGTELIPLELKHVGGYFADVRKWEANPPLHYVVQIQVQMACTGKSRGILAGMLPGYQLSWKVIDRDDDFLSVLVPKLEFFWRNVQGRIPPTVESYRDLAVVKNINKITEPEIELDDDTYELLQSWDEAKKEFRDSQKRASFLEAKIREKLGSHESGKLPDGTIIQRKVVCRQAYSVKATEYEKLKVLRK